MTSRAEPAAPRRPRTPPLVGRARELALLRDQLAAALDGEGALVLVGGAAGIGKSALLAALGREAAQQGALVLVGAAYDLADTPPYGPWAELLDPRALHTLGDLPPLPTPLAADRDGPPIASQAALFAQVRDYLAAVAARRPLVLFLDDLHWADPASLDLLRYIARQAAALSLLLVAAYRPEDVTRRHPLYALLPALVREAPLLRLALPRLAPDAVRALLRTRYPLDAPDEARLLAFLEERAEGNPFFLGELLRTLEETGVLHPRDGRWAVGDLAAVRLPTLLRQVIDGRLARLGEAAQRLLAVGAVIGQEVPLDLWAPVAGVGDDTLLDVVESAVEAHVLEETPGGTRARFVHALIREALYEGLPPSRRRVWHRRAGEALAALPEADPDAVAHHLRQAGDPRAVEWLTRAGERARQAYAWLTAAARYEAALALPSCGRAGAGRRGYLLYHLALMRRHAEPRRGIADLEEASRLAAAVEDRALWASALFARGFLRGHVGERREAVAEMAAGVAALDALSPADRAGLQALASVGLSPDAHNHRGTLALHLAMVGRYAEARALGERVMTGAPAATMAGAPDSSSSADALMALGHAHAAQGRPDEARRAYTQSRELLRAAGHHLIVGTCALAELRQVVLPYRTDDLAGRQRLAAEAEDAWARASGMWDTAPPTRPACLPLLLVAGGWAEVTPTWYSGDVPPVRLGSPELGALARYRGEPDLAWTLVRKELPQGPSTAPGDNLYWISVGLQRLAAALAVDAGELATARAWLEAHDRWLDWSGTLLGLAEGQLLWAAYHRTAGDLARAREHAERALAHATDPCQPLALLAAHRLLGELATAAGRCDEAAAHLAAARALADACAAPYERALTLLALAELRQVTDCRAEAQALLDEARPICIPLEAMPALARADALAARLAAPARPRSAYPAGLTAREVEVLRLIAAGESNRAIAAVLGISVRTVNRHITNLYTKIGARGKADATAYALRHRLA